MKSTRNRSRLADQGTKEMLPVIFSLAWPTMLEQLMQTAVQYMDTGMVGVLGTSATAAVGATSTVNWLIGSTISAISIGFLAYISQSIGAGKKEQAKKASGQAVLTVVIVGIFFTILTMGLSRKVPVWMQVDPSIQKLASSYFLILYAPMLFRTANIIFGTVLRAVGDTKTPMQVGVAFNVINIVLNFFLIYSTTFFFTSSSVHQNCADWWKRTGDPRRGMGRSRCSSCECYSLYHWRYCNYG